MERLSSHAAEDNLIWHDALQIPTSFVKRIYMIARRLAIFSHSIASWPVTDERRRIDVNGPTTAARLPECLPTSCLHIRRCMLVMASVIAES
jgi:hypothetical protein